VTSTAQTLSSTMMPVPTAAPATTGAVGANTATMTAVATQTAGMTGLTGTSTMTGAQPALQMLPLSWAYGNDGNILVTGIGSVDMVADAIDFRVSIEVTKKFTDMASSSSTGAALLPVQSTGAVPTGLPPATALPVQTGLPAASTRVPAVNTALPATGATAINTALPAINTALPAINTALPATARPTGLPLNTAVASTGTPAVLPPVNTGVVTGAVVDTGVPAMNTAVAQTGMETTTVTPADTNPAIGATDTSAGVHQEIPSLSNLPSFTIPSLTNLPSLSNIQIPSVPNVDVNSLLSGLLGETTTTPLTTTEPSPVVHTNAEIKALLDSIQSDLSTSSGNFLTWIRGSDFTQWVQNVQTAGLSITPLTAYSRTGSRDLVGYTALHSFTFRAIDMTRASDLVGQLTQHGITKIDSLNYALTDATMQQGQQQAIQKATQMAFTQANVGLNALNSLSANNNNNSAQGPTGFNFINMSVQTGGPSLFSPVPSLVSSLVGLFEDLASFQGAAIPLGGGINTVSATVTLTLRGRQ